MPGSYVAVPSPHAIVRLSLVNCLPLTNRSYCVVSANAIAGSIAIVKASAKAKPASFRILLMTLLSSWWTRKGVKPAFDAPWCNHEYRRLMSRSLRHVSDGSRGGAVFDSFAILCSMIDGTGGECPAHIARRLIIRRRRTHGPEMEPGGGTGGVCGGSRGIPRISAAMPKQSSW